MTQLTDRSAPLSSASAVERGRAAALTVSFLRGAIAAGVGLGVFAVLVLAMWIISPYPDSGAGGALRAAAALWLLAHGTDLLRTDTLSGDPAPLGVTPLLLMLLPLWLVHRASRDALEPDEERPPLTVPSVVATLTGGYLLVGAAAVLLVAGATLSARPVCAALTLPVMTVVAAAAGAWRARGRPRGPLPAWLPAAVRGGLGRIVAAPGVRRGTALALRAGAGSLLVLLGGGALLVGIWLAWHGAGAYGSFLRLAVDWPGRCALLLMGLALVPNAAVWGAAYGLGPGFALGTGVTVTPLGATGGGGDASSAFAPFAVAPGGAGPGLNWAVAVVPMAAAVALAWFTVRVAAPPYTTKEEAWGARATALTATLGGVVCGVLTAVLAAVSGGPMGTGKLTVLGPVWWLTGAAALVWTVGLGVPAALLLRARRLRERAAREAEEEAAEPAEVAEARQSFWRRPALRLGAGAVSASSGETAGGLDLLVADTEAARREREGEADAGEPSFEPYDFLPDKAWHERGARQTRWAAVKQASGRLTADFPDTGKPSGPTPVKKRSGPGGSDTDSGTVPGGGSGAVS
ncbi:cell division protein PerM [Streptomyces odonnellii]|uniref:cell division protein PerM n=1 Tax=Streptomyces odonnellii TaxID=1417980 RepID=UPI0012FEE079|nr:DUF6350 family protein [Streptomyces odonnellii]